MANGLGTADRKPLSQFKERVQRCIGDFQPITRASSRPAPLHAVARAVSLDLRLGGDTSAWPSYL